MTTIGAGWKKTDKNNKPYISVSIDKALLPLTIDEKKRLSVFPIADKENENGPDYRVVLYIPESPTQGEEKEEDLFP
jgi:uncharacterized protein (DUF736 family)